MEAAPDHSLIKLTYADVENTRKFYSLGDAKSINESLDTIIDWAKKQEHLAEAAEYMSRGYLERLLILSRGSVEGTKNKIDKLFTSRGLMPEMCLNQSVDQYDKILTSINMFPLPRLSPTDHTRVMFTKILENTDDFSMLAYFRYSFLLAEYRLHYDYLMGERFVIDLQHFKYSLLGKINPIIMKKAEILATEGYGTKIKGIHLLNAPSFIDKLVFILKTALKEKVASRIHVHSTYEDLHEHIPKEVLPKDYGGDEPSCEKLAEQWKEVLRTEEATEIIAKTEKRVADESKRPHSTNFNEEYMGMPGSFKRLNVD